MPLYSFWFQSSSTRPGVDEAGDVGLEREADEVGGEARLDGTALLARRGVGLVEVEPCAGVGLLEGRDDLLVGLARGRVGDEGEGAAAAVRGGVGVVAAAAAGRDEADENERRKGAQEGNARALVCHDFRSPLSLLFEWE